MGEQKIGFIYKICCNDLDIKEIYVGSCGSLRDRKWKHKFCCTTETDPKYNYPIYQYIRENGGWNNFDLIILERYEYTEKYELRARERYYVELLKASLNSVIPNRNKKEYYQDNKEKILERNKKWAIDNAEKNKQYHDQYYQDNKEQLDVHKREYNEENKDYFNQKKREYYQNNKDKWVQEEIMCECGKRIRGHKSRHDKSKRHCDWLRQVEN